MKLTITRADFANSNGYENSYRARLHPGGTNCPLAQALWREGNFVNYVSGDQVSLKRDIGYNFYKIPMDIWGGWDALYSIDRINKYAKWAKHPLLKFLVPKEITFEIIKTSLSEL